MQQTSWVCQSSQDADSSTALLKRACRANHFPFHEIDVIARSNQLPEMPELDGPFVIHGKTTLMLCAAGDPYWCRGMFFDYEQFRHTSYRIHYGHRLLNAEAQVMPIDDFIARSKDYLNPLFVKPNDDLKYITGDVRATADWCQLFQKLKKANVITGSSTLVVCQPKEVDAEWRLFFVNGKVVSGSMYRPGGDSYVPGEAIAFAEECARIWVPHPVFVMDVARSDGNWAVVECNCFNGSRFYNSDVDAIVTAVSEYQQAHFV